MTLQEHYDEKYNEGYADGLKLVRPSFSLKGATHFSCIAPFLGLFLILIYF